MPAFRFSHTRPVAVPESDARVERSSGGVVARRMEGSIHFLVIRDPYGIWALPKGHIEDGETTEEAALREVHEETGLKQIELGPWLGTIDWCFEQKGELVHKHCDYFLMVSPEGDITPQITEGITECRWLTVEEAIAIVGYNNTRRIVQLAEKLLRSTDGTKLL
ncbi:uncharacterized protein METZ01_LOCUS121925 [marine metagenome]|uniref:Nudix hydrolase domain-containing protein n=1 Tax=marine metagenome TaxID=408172 RepID=A0A381XXB7_9ZZZZ